jgi:hypothetical protein|tara:strand:- start:571 stop:1098 length:528 start_codon:yes stop_codon:yes gene_type:complete
VKDTDEAAVRYDLSALDAIERMMILDEIKESDISHQFDDGVLTVGRVDEASVDQIIATWEAWGEEQREFREHVDTAIEPGAQPDDVGCEHCGNSPAAEIVLRRQVGQVIVRTSYQVQLVLCDGCGEMVFKDFQKQTAIKGWLGIWSVVSNPVVMATNAKNRRKHRKVLQGGGTHG